MGRGRNRGGRNSLMEFYARWRAKTQQGKNPNEEAQSPKKPTYTKQDQDADKRTQRQMESNHGEPVDDLMQSPRPKSEKSMDGLSKEDNDKAVNIGKSLFERYQQTQPAYQEEREAEDDHDLEP